MNAQEVQQPTLSEFFDKLKTITPIKEDLRYDTFPDFDFLKFIPLQEDYGKKLSYVVGSTKEKKIHTIDFLKGNEVLGRMNVIIFRRSKS